MGNKRGGDGYHADKEDQKVHDVADDVLPADGTPAQMLQQATTEWETETLA